MSPDHLLPILLGVAWLLPLASFTMIVLVGPKMGKAGAFASTVATGAILSSFVLSVIAFGIWHFQHLGARDDAHPAAAAVGDAPHIEPHADAHAHGDAHADAHGDEHASHDATHAGHGVPTTPPNYYSKDVYLLAQVGKLKLAISYYIDSLTIADVHDGDADRSLHPLLRHRATCTTSCTRSSITRSRSRTGTTCTGRAGFTAFSSTCRCSASACWASSIAGNIAMVFVFWELVGICSYFLIGFYIERQERLERRRTRPSSSTALATSA